MKSIRSAAVSGFALAAVLSGSAVLAEQQITGEQTQEPAAMTSDSGSQQSGKITRTAEQIDGAKVVDSDGKDIGEVDELVRRKDDGEIYAVISVGGFFDIGDKDVALPLSQLSMQDGKIVVPKDLGSKARLKDHPGYDESRYSELDDEEQVQLERSDFAALEGTGRHGRSGDETRERDSGKQGY